MLFTARMGMLRASGGAVAPAGGSILKTDSRTDATNTGQYNFSNVSIGNPSSDRFLILCTAGRTTQGGGLVTNIVASGISFIKAIDTTVVTNCAIWYSNAVVDTGTEILSLQINATQGTLQNLGITMYALTGLGNQSLTLTDAQTNNTAGATTNVLMVAGGVAVGCAATSAGNIPNFVWDQLNADTDQLNESANGTSAMASVTSATSKTLSAACSAVQIQNFSVCYAAFTQS